MDTNREIRKARNAGGEVRDTMRVSESLENCMTAAKCPLSDRQILLLRGQLMVWIPKLQDEANRALLDRVDAAMKRHGR